MKPHQDPPSLYDLDGGFRVVAELRFPGGEGSQSPEQILQALTTFTLEKSGVVSRAEIRTVEVQPAELIYVTLNGIQQFAEAIGKLPTQGKRLYNLLQYMKSEGWPLEFMPLDELAENNQCWRWGKPSEGASAVNAQSLRRTALHLFNPAPGQINPEGLGPAMKDILWYFLDQLPAKEAEFLAHLTMAQTKDGHKNG